MGSLAVLVALSLALSIARASSTPKVAFDIPAEEISAALIEFYHQCGVQVMTASLGGSPVTTHAVWGKLEPLDALAQMLEGTGYSFQMDRDHFIWLAPRLLAGSAQPKAAESALN